MGVKVVETDSACDSFDDDVCAAFCVHGDAQNKPPNTAQTSATSSENPNLKYLAKDLVGNFKEFRIETNHSDLRIIGNGNRIRILNNNGRLQIIGNNTRLKIQLNSSDVKYTGNKGRIYLGSDSPQKKVDYIGCNGTLKIVKSSQLQGGECKSKAKQEHGYHGVKGSGVSMNSFNDKRQSPTISFSQPLKTESTVLFQTPTPKCSKKLLKDDSKGIEVNSLTVVRTDSTDGNIIVKNAINVRI